MAIGAWLSSKFSNRITNLLLGYALIEGLIGLLGLFFHSSFEFVNTLSFTQIIPALDTPYIPVYKFIAATLLILPQSILLGATFPLMCGGFIRKYPDIPGNSISLLYFSNSLGAALALLVATFYLIGKLGLPGTIFTAGLINIVIAIFVYGLAKEPVILQGSADKKIEQHDWPLLFLAASFFTGMASFIYEVAWIRMLSMVLGSSTHSFELMLSAFIFGLAIGGFWIRQRIDSIDDPIRFSGIVQIVMGLFAFSTVFLYTYCFDIMSFLVRALDKTEQGYVLFNISEQAIVLLIMLPATICAGMTLPLFTYALLKQGHGEKSIGLIYSSNTVGAIAGVIFAVFIGMPLLGLKNSILAGAMIDIVVGLFLLNKCITQGSIKYPVPSAALGLLLFCYAGFAYDFNTKRMSSGVYRHGFPDIGSNTEILYYKDGKTASISVVGHNNNETILLATNGKPDASITMDNSLPPTLDEITMQLLAAIPLAIHPEATNIAAIGMGSGMTTHVALTWPSVEKVDTIEIEDAVVEGARSFGNKTDKAYNDPRSHIHIADAKTFFSTYKQRYDIIISEPSNPWVSGVSSLFTQEFYHSIKPHLNENGLFVQWIHTYEFNLELLVSVLKSLASEFPYYSIYSTDNGNIMLIASQIKPVANPDPAIFESSEMSAELSRVFVNTMQDINFRFLGDQNVYNPFIKSYPVPINSDYYPILDLRAPKSRFLRENVDGLLNIRFSSVPILDLLYDSEARNSGALTTSKSTLQYSRYVNDANNIYTVFDKSAFLENYPEYFSSIQYLKNFSASCL